MRISDWSSDVCSSDLTFVNTLSIYAGAYLTEVFRAGLTSVPERYVEAAKAIGLRPWQTQVYVVLPLTFRIVLPSLSNNFISLFKDTSLAAAIAIPELTFRSEEHTSELQSLMRISYAVFCLTKKKYNQNNTT